MRTVKRAGYLPHPPVTLSRGVREVDSGEHSGVRRFEPEGPLTSGIAYMGIDNGVSGTVAVMDPLGRVLMFGLTPTFSEINYTKDRKNCTRLDFKESLRLMQEIALRQGVTHLRVVMERPMVNPGRFLATASALRCHEAWLITLQLAQDHFGLEYSIRFLDSKEWQSKVLPHIPKKGDTKAPSADVGMRLTSDPKHRELIRKHKDADGLCMAEFARRERL